jgi:RNA polymerase sigma factor (sigma-70 family)
MDTATLGGALRKVFDRVRGDAGRGDGELLTRYRAMRDQDAFGSLVRRHGPMVLGVCRRILRDHHAADDAIQATFLVLARKADAVRPPDRLAPWLYGVAYRTALKARGRASRRQQVEAAYAAEATRRGAPVAADGAAELLPLLDEQLNALPEKYRTSLLLCGVQGLNKAEAAERLGLPEGTVSSRLARAREMLRERLARRGVAVPAAAADALLTADTLQAAVPPALAAAASATALGSDAPATILTLSHEVIRSMTLCKLKFLGAIALAVSLSGGGSGSSPSRPGGRNPPAKSPRSGSRARSRTSPSRPPRTTSRNPVPRSRP